MPTFNDKITNFVAGDDLEITRTISGVPAGSALTRAWLTIKGRPTDADADAVLQKVITVADVPGTGQITDDGGTTGVAAVRFDLTAADTDRLTPVQIYYFDLQVETDAGKIYTPDMGTIVARGQITLAGA
jgi:hypothetical protein